MTCADFQERAAALALGALDADEAAACEAHLAEPIAHAGCREALAQARDAAALMGLSLPPVRSGAESWAAIERRLGPTSAATNPRRRRWPAMAAWAVAAAALLLVVWLARDRARLAGGLRDLEANAARERVARQACVADLAKLRSDADLQRRAIAMLSQPGSRLVSLEPQMGGVAAARMVMQPGERRAILIGRGLAKPAGKDYELWIIRGNDKVAAGLLRGGEGGALITEIDPGLLAGAAPDAVAITLEPEGGGTQPRGPAVLVGKI